MSLSAADDLALILDAASEAAETALKLRKAGVETTVKADGTPVTDADLAVDALLRERLTAARPEYGWLSEETADDPVRLARERVFVVDPIDGTRAFLKGRPWWAVSIAVVEAGHPIVGVVQAPDLDEVYHAVAGGGAYLGDRRLAASLRDSVEGCAMVAAPGQFSHSGWPQPWPPMTVKNRNSTAYRLCLVASGAFDAALAMTVKKEWDLAAGDLIAREAGCIVTDHKGDAFGYNKVDPWFRSLVCAGPTLHPLLLARVSPIELRT
jgi:myo-inositol-1(or 4)-monophosphatase